MAVRCVLLDRDGTIIVERRYLSDWRQVELLPGAAEGLRHMRAMGLGLAVVTNQSGVGRGYYTLADMERVHARMRELLAAQGVELDGVYFCPHAPEDRCACRKPAPGLLRQAAAELGFSPAECVVIGDKPCDIDLGRAVGAAAILVRTGYGAEWEGREECRPDQVAADLADAAAILCRILAGTV